MLRPGPMLGAAVLAAAVCGYALLAHHFTVSDDRSSLAWLFAMGSACAMGMAWAWTRRRRVLWLALIALLVAAIYLGREAIDLDPRWIYLAEHAGINAALGVLFGSSLAHARRPLVTRLATVVHGNLPPEVARYTRGVTIAWTVFFAAMTGLSLLLFFLAPTQWWSWLANFLTLPAVALMFVAEYAVRRWRLPDFSHASLIDSIRSFQRHQP